MTDDYEFALCLTHDVDRPYKRLQSLYYALVRRDPRQIRSILSGVNPWWQFEEIMELEEELGVRSAFYFLNEQHLLERSPDDWLASTSWVEHLGRYEVDAPEIVEVMRELNEGGWEVGLHGSYASYDDRERLRAEKETLEQTLGDEIRGGRQHYLNLNVPETWQYHSDIGLKYDASLGSSTEFGFQHGHGVARPFDDEFVVFPLTVMEIALPDAMTNTERAWRECERLLQEAATNDAVMTVLWHPRMFNERDFPGFRRIYRRLIERALEMGAWVGPPGDLYERLDHPPADRTDRGKAILRGP